MYSVQLFSVQYCKDLRLCQSKQSGTTGPQLMPLGYNCPWAQAVVEACTVTLTVRTTLDLVHFSAPLCPSFLSPPILRRCCHLLLPLLFLSPSSDQPFYYHYSPSLLLLLPPLFLFFSLLIVCLRKSQFFSIRGYEWIGQCSPH